MTSKLKTHFPLIREHEEILKAIRSNPNLANIYNSWTAARQNEFMNFCTGVKGIKVLFVSDMSQYRKGDEYVL